MKSILFLIFSPILVPFVFFNLFYGVLSNILSRGGHPFDGAYNRMVEREYQEQLEWEKKEKARTKNLMDELLDRRSQNPYFFIEANTGLTRQLIRNTPRNYQVIPIPKQSGGIRHLNIPNDELKSVQTLLSIFLEKQFDSEIHTCAHAYRKNRSILSNATPHLNNKVLVKLDIRHFFINITEEQVKEAVYLGHRSVSFDTNFLDFNRWLNIDSYALDYLSDEDVAKDFMSLVYSEYGLPQGAPTSPIISNLVLKKFDDEVFKFVKSLNGKYTRYSDDISISFSENDAKKVGQSIKFVEAKLLENGFNLNKKKGKIQVLRPHQAQRICGITINSGTTTVSRKQRRLIRAAEHNSKLGLTCSFSENQIKGHKSYHSYVSDKGMAIMNDNLVMLDYRDTKASGFANGKQFTIIRGSIFKYTMSVKNEPDKFHIMLDYLIENKIVKSISNERYRFSKNHTFNSKTEATSLLYLKKTSPTGKWK